MTRREPPLPGPKQAELESELNELLKHRSRKTGAGRRRVFRGDPRDVTDKLESMVDIGHEDTALAHASQWIAELDPDDRDETLELANRLLSLSQIGLWNASWSDVLARAVRSLKPTERGPWVPLMRQRL